MCAGVLYSIEVCYPVCMEKMIVDIEKFHDFATSDAGDRDKMAQLFIDQAGVYLQELVSVHEYDAVEEWREVAHKFKGMAGFAGAVQLYESCYRAQNEYDAERSERAEILNIISRDVDESVTYFKTYIKGM
jgi:HPt (histidine-containing phosphotransfer) domain-containing protein